MKRHAVSVCIECALWADGSLFDSDGPEAAATHGDKVDAMWGVADYRMDITGAAQFSNSPCEGCGDKQSGSRQAAVMTSIQREGRATEFHLEV